jgi:hypothetical protein
MSDARNAWLGSLVIGADVAVDCSRYGGVEYHKGTVVKFTPKFVDVQAHYQAPIRFRRGDGREVKGDRYHPMRLVPIDDAVRAVWRRQVALSRVRCVVWPSLTTDQLEAVIAALPAPKEAA